MGRVKGDAVKGLAGCASMVLALCAGCGSSGVSGAQGAADGGAGPVQDVHLSGAQTMYLDTSEDPSGLSLAAPAPDGSGTGCWEWTDADGVPHWQARISGMAAGHRIQLNLATTALGLVPLGTHPTLGLHSMGATAVLYVDGQVFPSVAQVPSDAMPSYFTLDHDGTTGLVSIRFAASDGATQAFYTVGRWRCA